MAVSASELRQNVYRLLDEVLRTGQPLEIERGGRRLRIVPVEAPAKLSRLSPHPGTILGDPEELVHLDWTGEWRP
ncbi:MAG TPA: type II toxin-antitoxin system Phd/YefM family antitoxin [Actinomycetes bacterium]|jgi:antitoxin (DNA-binding transcriptional repressor) of toxin-antitoxin stability system|nr:type II toxin-antitoxin system Phd/YefM family antitoxin [Actinomycetes bacterium]